MKYVNCGDKVQNMEIKNIVTELSQAVTPIDRIIHTKDWGSFKLRKNGRIRLRVGNDIIRCTPIKITIPDIEIMNKSYLKGR